MRPIHDLLCPGRPTLLFLFVAMIGLSSCDEPSVPLSSVSPNGQLKVNVVEKSRGASIDYNFMVTATRSANGDTVLSFNSPDEGPPSGRERLIWSKDSRFAMLVGDRYFIEHPICTSDGEKVYLLMDVWAGRIYCNSDQVVDGEYLKLSQLTSIAFAEPVTFVECKDPTNEPNSPPVR